MKMFPALNKGLLLAGTSSILVLAMFANAEGAFSQDAGSNFGSPSVDVISPIAEPSVGDGLPFQISVDGVPVSGSAEPGFVSSAISEASLDNLDVQLTFDGLKLDKTLNITSNKGAYAAGEQVRFQGFWNYSAFVKSAEIRVFSADTSVDGTPLVVVDLPADRALSWEYPAGMPDEVQFVLRVYDRNDKFDETTPKRLSSLDQPAQSASAFASADAAVLDGYDKNSLNVNGIAVSGGTVTVFGTSVPDQSSVQVLGSPVPVDNNGKFVASEILPAGDHTVPITVLNGSGEGLEFQRSLYIPGSDLFYVGLGDFTIGTGASTGPTELVGENSEWGDIDAQGRVAAFVRGKVADSVFITAQADTGMGSIDPNDENSIFHNFLDRDPRKLVDRVQTFETYNTFGDQSSIERVVDTQGKFFVKVEQGESYAMWGNFQTNINGPVFANVNRSLYGASLSYKADTIQTPGGKPAIEVDAFVAQQGTVGHRDVMRGTGGSVYFLTFQDIQRGGERLTVEIRDSFTGLVKNTKQLVYGQDYDIDSVQGRVILNEALPSTVSNGYLVDDGLAESGDQAFLVIDYEYSPQGFDQFQDLYYGGRAVGRLGDFVTVGGTFLRDENSAPGTSAKQLIGADVALSAGGNSYIRGEVAITEGDARTEFGSDDGGYSITDNNSGAQGVDGAMAYRVDAQVDTSDFTDAINAKLTAYYQHKDAGSTAGSYNEFETDSFGGTINVPVADIVTLSARYDNVTTDNGVTTSTVQRANIDAKATFDALTATVGVGFSDTDGEKSQTNVGGAVEYKVSDQLSVGVKASTTIQSTDESEGTSTIGAIVRSQITDRLSVNAGVDYSFDNDTPDEGKVTARIGSDFNMDDQTKFNVGYSLNTGGNALLDANNLSGDLNFGFKRQLTDSLNFYIEERLSHKGQSVEGLTHMFGLDFAPDSAWRGALNAEFGEVNDLDRQAVSVNAGYRGDGFDIGGALEYRREQREGSDDIRQTYVGKANATFNVSDDWVAKADVNAVLSQQNDRFIDGNFIEGTVGAAYRPVDNNRVNALFRYTFLYDLPTDTNVDVTLGATGNIGSLTAYKQRSHILEADGIFKLNDNITLGAKYGVRLGEVTTSRDSEEFFGDTIHLGVVRADFHVVRDWDALIEGRVMYQQDTNTTRFGAVAAVYRHIGDNFKVGVGYNFGQFNDDLTNVSFDSQGIFLNAIAKF